MQLDGCLWAPRLVCPLSADFAQVARLAGTLTQTTRALGTARARSVGVLLLCEGSGGRDDAFNAPQRAWVLLSMVSLSPAFQVYTLCDKVSGGNAQEDEAAFPVDVELRLAPSALDVAYGLGGEPCLVHKSGEELAALLLQTAPSWSVRPCEYSLLSSLRMRVVGVEEGAEGSRGETSQDRETAMLLRAAFAFERGGNAGAAPHRRSAQASTTRGRAAMAVTSRGSTSAAGPRPLADDEHPLGEPQQDGDIDESDEDYMQGHGRQHEACAPHLDNDLVALGDELLIYEADGVLVDEAPMDGDVDPAQEAPLPPNPAPLSQQGASDVAGVVGDVVGNIADILVASGAASAEATTEVPRPAASSSSIEAEEAGATDPPLFVASDAASSSGVAEPAEVNGPVDPIVGWRCTEDGYVFSEDNRYMGHITTWRNKNISCKCSLHGPKCAIAKPLVRCTKRDMMLWLKAGESVVINEEVNAYLAVELHRIKM